MEFTNEIILKEYPAFFKKYDVAVEQTKLSEILAECWEAKEELRKVLPFDASGRLLLEEYDVENSTLSNMFPNTINVLAESMAPLPGCPAFRTARLNAILTNAMPTGAKLSRAMLGNAKACERIKTHASRVDLCTELPILPLTGKTDPALIIQNFYSELTKMRGKKLQLQLSVNPFDIFNASNSKAFNSCFAVGNIHAASVVSAGTSSSVMLLRYVDSSGDMMGRAWVAIGADYLSVSVQPTYGYLRDDSVKVLAAKLAELLTPGVPWTKAKKDEWSCGTYSAQLSRVVSSDYHHFYFDGATKVFLAPGAGPAVYDLGHVRCLICGKLHTNSDVICGVCKHAMRSCKVCQKMFMPKKVFEEITGETPRDRYIRRAEYERLYLACSECSDKLTACNNCGAFTKVNDVGMCVDCAPTNATGRTADNRVLYRHCLFCGDGIPVTASFNRAHMLTHPETNLPLIVMCAYCAARIGISVSHGRIASSKPDPRIVITDNNSEDRKLVARAVGGDYAGFVSRALAYYRAVAGRQDREPEIVKKRRQAVVEQGVAAQLLWRNQPIPLIPLVEGAIPGQAAA